MVCRRPELGCAVAAASSYPITGNSAVVSQFKSSPLKQDSMKLVYMSPRIVAEQHCPSNRSHPTPWEPNVDRSRSPAGIPDATSAAPSDRMMASRGVNSMRLVGFVVGHAQARAETLRETVQRDEGARHEAGRRRSRWARDLFELGAWVRISTTTSASVTVVRYRRRRGRWHV